MVLQAAQAANGNYNSGTQNAGFTVSKASPAVALSSSSNPSSYRGSVVFAATMHAYATGMVTFLDGSSTLGSETISSGIATLTTSTLTGGSHSIQAQYAGDANDNAARSSALMQMVDCSPVTVFVASANYPYMYGDRVTLTLTFTGSGAAIPTRTAAVTEGENALTTVSLDGTGKAPIQPPH